MLVQALTLCATSLAPSSSPGTADEWPGWRGPDGKGIASGSPPVEWSEEKNVRWKTAIPGKGTSSPVVWGERIFLTTSVGTGKKAETKPPGEDGGERRGPRERGARDGEGGRDRGDRPGDRPDGPGPGRGERPDGGRPGPGRGGPGGFMGEVAIEEQEFSVLALDRKSGAILWQKKVGTAMPHEGTHPDGSYASPTATTDGEHVFASFGSYGVYALTMAGEVAWQQDLGDLHMGGFGEGSSPLLCGGLLVLNWGQEGESFLVALDKRTGEERWRTPRPEGMNWCTPILVRVGDTSEIVVGGQRTGTYDPLTGRELWSYGEAERGRGGSIASPIAMDELVLLPAAGRGRGEMRALVALSASEAGPDAEPLLWSEPAAVPHVSSPLAYRGKLYFLKENSGLLSVLDTTSGKLEYGPERLKGVADVYASPVVAGGRLYIAGRDGTVEVLSPWPEIETLAVNTLDDGFDASPAVAADELFLRGRSKLYCIAGK